MIREADELALDIAAAQRWAENATPAERACYEHFIETTERRLETMRTPAPIPMPAEPTTAGAAPDPRETGKCGCGRSWPHGGRCSWKRAQEKNGGGQKRKKAEPRPRTAEAAAPEPAPIEAAPAGLAEASAADPTASLKFQIVAIRGEDRVETSGSSPEMLRKVIELIGSI